MQTKYGIDASFTAETIRSTYSLMNIPIKHELTDIKRKEMKQSHFKIQELLVKEEKILFILYIRKVFLKIDENSSIAT